MLIDLVGTDCSSTVPRPLFPVLVVGDDPAFILFPSSGIPHWNSCVICSV
jgi:hypothetical protein